MILPINQIIPLKIGVLEKLALNINPKAFEIITDNWQKIISLDENMLKTFWKNLSSNPNIFHKPNIN